MTPSPDVCALVEQARAGSPRAVARLISLIEDGAPQLREVTAALAPHAGRAHVVGLTGAPGVGKSTVTSALVGLLRGEDLRVGVLAVDPTSPFSGGALLGDRVRMQDHATDPEVYIRSMATRGHLGGLAAASVQAIRVLDAVGCDVVLVETVGVGQSEVQVAAEADTTVVLLAPGMGDAIQTFKAGILEIGDVFCVNKADRDGVEQTVRELRHMISLAERRAPGDWRPPVVRAVAVKDEGVDELLEAIRKHRAWLDEGDRLGELRRRRIAAEIEAIALAELRRGFAGVHGDKRLDVLADRVADGELDPYRAADELVAELTGGTE